MEHEALECSDMVDESVRYIASTMFSKLHMLINISHLYALIDEKMSDWPAETNCHLEL